MKIDWYRFLPRYWRQNYPTNWEWDAKLNELLDRNPEVKAEFCTVTLDYVEVWVDNYPYAYGSPRNYPSVSVLPSVKTRRRLKNYLKDRSEAGFKEWVDSI